MLLENVHVDHYDLVYDHSTAGIYMPHHPVLKTLSSPLSEWLIRNPQLIDDMFLPPSFLQG